MKPPVSTSQAASIPASSQPAPQPSPASKAVDELFKKEGVDKLYSKEVHDSIRERLIKLCEKNSAKTGQYLGYFRTNLLAERRKVGRHYINVKRQIKECDEYWLKTGQTHNSGLAFQIAQNLPYEDSKFRWNEHINDQYEPEVGSNFGSFIGGTEKQRTDIKERDRPIFHTKPPSSAYRNMVKDTEAQVRDAVRINDARVRVFLDENGRDLSSEERENLTTFSPTLNRVGNLAESLVSNVHSIATGVGRGIISKSKAANSSNARKLLQKRNEILAQTLWRFNPKSAYPEIWKQYNQILASSDDLFDQANFAAMQQLISKAIEADKTAREGELEAINKQMLDWNSSMLDRVQKIDSDAGDDMHKYRLLQIFLLLSPFCAFSALGGMFNYIDPFAHLLGPMFDGALTTSQGIASIVKSPVLGPFGVVADKLEIDTALQWTLDHVPIVSQICDVFDAVSDNNISQGFFKLLSPLIKSPLLPLGIAGLYSFPFRADAEVKQYEAVKKMMDEQEAALKKVAADFKKDSTAGQMKRLRTFAEDKFDSDLITNFNLCLAQFIAKASKEELAIFDDVKFDVKEEKDDKKEVTVKRTFAELREKGGLSTDPLAILNSILKMADKQKLEDPFLLFTAVEKPERTTGQNLDEFTKAGQNQKKSKELIAAQRKALDQNFVFDRAKKYGFSSPETDKDKRYEAFKKQIIERDFNFVRSMAEYDTPSTEVHKPTGSPMYGDSKQITSKL